MNGAKQLMATNRLRENLQVGVIVRAVESRHNENLDRGAHLLGIAGKLYALNPTGHTYIGDHDVYRLRKLLKQPACLNGIRRLQHVVTTLLKSPYEEVSDDGFILDDEDAVLIGAFHNTGGATCASRIDRRTQPEPSMNIMGKYLGRHAAQGVKSHYGGAIRFWNTVSMADENVRSDPAPGGAQA